MFRINILGKVGYFKTHNEATSFGYDVAARASDEEILNDMLVSKERLQNDFLNLKAFNSQRLFRRHYIFKNHVGVIAANYFMQFRFELRAYKKKSPLEAIRDKKMFMYAAGSHYWMQGMNDLRGIKDVFDRLRIRGGSQELNNFPPVVAKCLYERYCPVAHGKILDISSGFGGRAVGAMSSRFEYEYTGVDPSSRAVGQTRKLIKFLNCEDRAKIIEKPFEDTDEDLPNDYFDFCFTSPPYFKKEIYSDEPTQSIARYEELEAWRVGFLLKSFEIARKKLKAGCLMTININDIKLEKDIIPLGEITIKTAREAGFEYLGFDKMLIGNRFNSLKRSRRARREYNYEPIFKFKK